MKTFVSTLVAAAWLFATPGLSAEEEAPVQVEACELINNTIAYHRKLVRVEGRVHRGFEDFTLSSKSCPDISARIWLEYGGPAPAGTNYCCAGDEASRPNGRYPLTIDGIATSLVRNIPFRDLDRKTRNLRRGDSVRAVLIGRVFAKRAYENGDTEQDFMAGFGHFGMYSLLVIQRVEKVR
jgi:hypothetical protein